MDGDRQGQAGWFPWAEQWPEITDARVRRAFARVDRRRFVPASVRDLADRDTPLPIGEGQTISQPFVIALMVQALNLQPGDRVLEVGTGSGYQTALLCEVTHVEGGVPGASVYSVERFSSLLVEAARALEGAGYFPSLNAGDGAAGWPEHAPFDGIVVSAAASRLPLPLWEQLVTGGRMVIPVGGGVDDQMLWLVRKVNENRRCESLGPVRFVPLISPLLDNPANRLKIP